MTLEYCKYFDDLKAVNTTLLSGYRYQSMLVLRYKDGKDQDKMSIRDDFKVAARSLVAASHQEGEKYSYIPRGGRFRQRPLNAQLEADMDCRSQHCQDIYGSQASSSSSSATWWANRHWHGWDSAKWHQQHQPHQENGTVKIAGKSEGYRLFQAM